MHRDIGIAIGSPNRSSDSENRDVSALLERRPKFLARLALRARADLTQIGKRIDPRSVAVIPIELDCVMADLSRARNSDGALSEHRKRVRLCLDFRRLIATGSTGTAPAEIGVGISGLVTVAPSDGNAAGRGKLDRGRERIH